MTDKRDIERIYREHGHVVRRRARELLGSDSEASDALHEIFVSLLARPGQLEGVVKVTAWLYRATTHHCLNQIRDRNGRHRLLSALPRTGETSPRAEQAVAVRTLLARLPGFFAEVAVYYYLDEMTQDEIAALLGCSRRNVGRMLARLHDQLEPSAERARRDPVEQGT